jgi:predicted dehydrogenase
MPERPLRLCLVGCGGVSRAYVEALRRTGGQRLVAAVDPVAARAEATAAPHGARAATDLAAVLDDGPPFDAALVLTPPDTHEALSTMLLSAGVHVLCEKPLALSTASAQRMLASARGHRRLLMMGSKFRYTEDVTRARRLLDDGVLGDVLLFENVFCTRIDMARRWNSVRSVAGGGVLIDNGCHSADIARYLLGPIRRVQARFGQPVQRLEVEDTVRLSFEAGAGTMGTVDLSWSLHKEDPTYVRLHGSRGALEIGWRVSRCKRAGEADWTAFGSGYDKVAAFAAQLDDFAAAIRGERAPVITDADAIASVQVIEAAYRSAVAHRWQELPPEAP